jgi:hypothetical protein
MKVHAIRPVTKASEKDRFLETPGGMQTEYGSRVPELWGRVMS